LTQEFKMRFDVNRICELAGLGAASGGLMNEAAAPAAPAKPMAPGAKAPPAAPAKPTATAAKTAPAAPAKPVAEEDYAATDEGDHNDLVMPDGDIMDNEMYEIDEYALMEALVDMRQRRLEESNVRDAVREEIQRALSDRSASWVYGANKPTSSKQGQISRGGFGIGFGFRR